ncbi:hypothetical protein GU243_08965 [Pseudarthrobacter psychrotolerans]|uniref:Uncharacterized protein n=1 Tax=Pseudarthrobacter psychrotolerans TaxID=2697569 RepID=A0A6P1NHN8_9MICC|nr:hypothetical protein [Pseudarthrobacter psychrotolerans]QHK19846.1 hypothetical protein GU243_08965 [Pseudarthrobacter psychrotolerans]
MTAIFWIAIMITCAASIAAAYLVVADYWRDRTGRSRDQIVDITENAHETAGRLDAAYQQALRDMRRRQ